jgi:hypothetical protein
MGSPYVPKRTNALPPTLGRLGGLAPGEADRGERALWLAGDGYRAALFHLGALTRLNEVGLLAQIGTIGAVSGGAIAAAVVAAQIEWPLAGAFRDWPEQVAEPLREIAGRNVRARALLRHPFPGAAAEAGIEERYARELIEALGGESTWGPRFVFGASGLTLSGLAAGWEECLEWEIGTETGAAPGYPRELVERVAAVRTGLAGFGAAEQAVLENHGYLLADAAVRARGLAGGGGIRPGPAEPPHPEWMSEARVREALAGSSRRRLLRRLRPRPAGAGERRPEPRAEETTELLDRHRPVLHYDSLESCRADSAATICAVAAPGRRNSLHRADGCLIAAVEPGGEGPALDLGFLGAAYPDGSAARPDDYLDECGGSHVADAIALRGRRRELADVVYGRGRRDGDGRLWLQYWFFYYWDDRAGLGIQRHEGDWEMVQVRLGLDGFPEAATFARHGGAVALDWEQVELAATGGEGSLVVYPARGCHASLPRPGSHPALLLPDHNDGLGPQVRPRLEPIGDDGPGWVLWPGRWGSTRRREHFEADSPRGPREQAQWWDPADLHAEATPWEGGAARWTGARRTVAQRETAARSTPSGAPSSPRLEAHREGDLAVVSFGFGPSGGEPPARIIAAPAGGGAEPVPTHTFPVDRGAGSFSLPLPPGREWTGVRAAVASEVGVSGETITVPLR